MSKRACNMSCGCLVVSLITLLLVCVLVYKGFMPNVDGFQSNNGNNSNNTPTMAVVKNAEDAKNRSQAFMQFESCMAQSPNPKVCCENMSDKLKQYLPMCQ